MQRWDNVFREHKYHSCGVSEPYDTYKAFFTLADIVTQR